MIEIILTCCLIVTVAVQSCTNIAFNARLKSLEWDVGRLRTDVDATFAAHLRLEAGVRDALFHHVGENRNSMPGDA